ncbi:hypothetical protein, partial [Dyadobacter frigoris]|uniref:hypothetical protein n=1 Tax=Dyadobacter frigoris TaxID=2576211 RepID=UPI002557BBE8
TDIVARGFNPGKKNPPNPDPKCHRHDQFITPAFTTREKAIPNPDPNAVGMTDIVARGFNPGK